MSAVEQEPSTLRSVGLPWLVRLRMLLLVLLAATTLLDHHLSLPAGLGLVTAGLLTNAALARVSRRGERITRAAILLVLLLDTAALTWVLAGAGGPANPFSTLYLVNLSLASLLLSPAELVTVGVASATGYGLLFNNLDMQTLHGPGAFEDHLRGMWVSFAVSAALIGGFVFATRRALERKEAELRTVRERAARMDRLAALASLAAGAAHELGTPLASIRTAGRELERALTGDPREADLRGELDTLRLSVDRCRVILARLARGGGEIPGESPEPVPLPRVWEQAAGMLPPATAARVRVTLPQDAHVRVPMSATAEAIKNLVQNAVDASPPQAPVELHAVTTAQGWAVSVLDTGTGVPPHIRERLGEPFVTSKPDGMGLGLYLAVGLCRQLHTEFTLVDGPEGGTCATMVLPRA